MNTIFSLFPNLPWSDTEIVLNITAGVGAILLIYGIFLEAEHKQDLVFFFGATMLGVYAYWIGNKIFTVAMIGFGLGSLVEYLEIIFGRHVHSEELVKKYKNPKE
jgi:hypothetical protein